MQNGLATAVPCPVSVRSGGSKSDFYFQGITAKTWYYALHTYMKDSSMKFYVD